MLSPESESPVRPADLADETVTTVRRWLVESQDAPADPSAKRLAGLLSDPLGLDFALGFVDGVVRPEDLRVAGRNLEKLTHAIPSFLPWYLRAAIFVGGNVAILLPWPVVPIARWVLRRMVGHLVIDATPAQLGKSLAKLRGRGIRLNLNLLGEAVLGDEEAAHRLAGTRELLERDDVDYVSIKVSNVASQLSMWAFDDMVDDRRRAAHAAVRVRRSLADDEVHQPRHGGVPRPRPDDRGVHAPARAAALKNLEAGIVLQAYLPDALGALQRLTEWAIARRAAGGAGIKVRVVKGANLAMEHVDATLHDWPLATYGTKVETDTNYKRVLEWALTPERTDAVRIGVAGHNLFDVAFAWLLAKRRRVETRVDFEMLLGMATGQAEAVKRDVGGLLLYTPVVQPKEFDSAISYLIRRLEENASTENFMSGVFELATQRADLRARGGPLPRVARRARPRPRLPKPPRPNRVQDRGVTAAREARGFANEPDTDPSIPANRVWGARMLERSRDSRLGVGTIEVARVTDPAELERLIQQAAAAGADWGARPAPIAPRVLHDAGDVLAAFRGRLIEVMASETGKTIAEGDVEVSEAVDFAHYYAESALELEGVDGAVFVPPRAHGRHAPVELPGRDPRRIRARGARRGQRRDHQARSAGQALAAP